MNCIPGMQKLTRAAHEHGAKIAVQLYHGGREARFVKTKKQLPIAPSVIADDPFYKGPYREITEDEIDEVDPCIRSGSPPGAGGRL